MAINHFPNLSPCKITVKGTKHTIELLGKVTADEVSIIFDLIINGVQHDNIEFVVSQKPLVGIIEGNDFTLHGTLYGESDDDIAVRVEGQSGEFARPDYSFYVGEQCVHKEKGLPRRF